MTNSVKIIIDDKKIEVKQGTTVLQAADKAGIHIPRLCYHKRLSVAGKCRMCLVEIEGLDKPVSSCTCIATNGMHVKTKSALAVQSRKDILEFLLANHPLDCPTCKKANECSLQNIVIENEMITSNFPDSKKENESVDFSEDIRYVPNRCIHCMRCVRFCDEIAGRPELGEFNKGANKIISTGIGEKITSNLSGNLLDICPVGALIDKNFKNSNGRIWELEKFETIDTSDSICPNIYVDIKDEKVARITGRDNEHINQGWISNSTRFSYIDLYKNRIKSPRLNSQDTQWSVVLDFLLSELNNYKKENIAALIGKGLALEDIFSFEQVMSKSLNIQNIGITSNGTTSKTTLFECSIDEIEQADSIFFIGTDFENDSPVLNSRILQTVNEKNIKVYNIGSYLEGYTYPIHNLGETVQEIIANKNQIFDTLENSKCSVIFIDIESIIPRTDSLAILNVLEEFKDKYNVVINFFSKDSGLINANMLYDCLNMQGYYDNIKENLQSEKIDVLFVYGDQFIPSELARKAKLLIYAGNTENDISKIADVVLPTVTSFEKNSLWTNVEGRIQEAKAVHHPYKDSKVDWKVWRALSEYLGSPLSFDDLNSLRKTLARKYPQAAKKNIGKIIKNY